MDLGLDENGKQVRCVLHGPYLDQNQANETKTNKSDASSPLGLERDTSEVSNKKVRKAMARLWPMMKPLTLCPAVPQLAVDIVKAEY